MDQTSVPFELISYRGLLKPIEDFKKRRQQEGSPTSLTHFGLKYAKDFVLFHIFLAVSVVESFLFFLMNGYDNYVYTPLQKILSPLVALVPRYLNVGNSVKLTILSANLVTLSRTLLVIPIAWFLKYDMNWMAFWCVVYHDFLDHLDGIVAKVHRVKYPNQDDPLLGGFLDAFCDKIVNVFSLWTIIQVVHLNEILTFDTLALLGICYGVIAYEVVIGIVRVEDFFLARFKRDMNIREVTQEEIDPAKVVAASMEGKLKEKLESTGIAFLCLSVAKTNQDQIMNISGIVGLLCLVLTLRMAHKSLMVKLNNRKSIKSNIDTNNNQLAMSDIMSKSIEGNFDEQQGDESETDDQNEEFESAEMRVVDYKDNELTTPDQSVKYKYKKRRVSIKTSLLSRSRKEKLFGSLMSNPIEEDNRVDKVYTVGCFDLFHDGHINLLIRMREIGKKVIVGVHDSKSIFKLKNRVPIDCTEKRMLNVKRYADEVFCVAGCDPSNFMTCVVNLDKGESAAYVRGDDMPDFPCRSVVENLMPIKFLPYTEGVSSTLLRREKYSHIANDDQKYLEENY